MKEDLLTVVSEIENQDTAYETKHTEKTLLLILRINETAEELTSSAIAKTTIGLTHLFKRKLTLLYSRA